jgi:hypothetical protein
VKLFYASNFFFFEAVLEAYQSSLAIPTKGELGLEYNSRYIFNLHLLCSLLVYLVSMMILKSSYRFLPALFSIGQSVSY